MKIKYILALTAVMLTTATYAQNDVYNYRRSSIYSVLIAHEDQQFATEIEKAFLEIPVPDKYNDHDLSNKILYYNTSLDMSNSKKRQNMIIDDSNVSKEMNLVDIFVRDNRIASRLVGKWFDRDMFTGQCDMELIRQRGLTGSSENLRQEALRNQRKMAILEDAGEELIGNTFVLINDIHYFDKQKTAKFLGAMLRVAGSALAQSTGVNTWDDLGKLTGSMAETLKGFNVKINTYLYQLVWNDSIQANFYLKQYSATPNESKCDFFEKHRGEFQLKYVGKQESSGSTTSFMGIKEDEPIKMVRKACQRALDENVANLQKNFEDFKVKSPLINVEPIEAYVGLKEGITADSKYEVLQPIENENGKIEYKSVGMIQPIESKIWDNRYMAEEEGAPNAKLGFTSFKKIKGSKFLPGMLIKEIK
jgi:hypothetical protein